MVGVFDILSLACLLNFQSALSGLNYPSLSEIGVVNQIFFPPKFCSKVINCASSNQMNIQYALKIYLLLGRHVLN